MVFGDHTRALKYVDFPFVRGADGTQVLKPRTGIDPLYFYYACRSLDLPSRGYNRHFRALKEKEILIPSGLDEQKGIARGLRCLDEALALQLAQGTTSEELKRATMRALFTRGLRGEAQKDTQIGPVPESWESMPISALGDVVTGNTPPTKYAANYVGGKIPFIAPGDIEHGLPITETEKLITEQGLACSRPIKAGTTCFVCIGSTIGKVGYVTAPICATNQQINSIVPREDFDELFVFYLMTFWSDHVRQQASPSPVSILSKGAFEQIEIMTSTNRDEQREIAQILEAIDRKIDLHQRKRAVFDELLNTLLHTLMAGEIPVTDLDLSALATRISAEIAT